MTIVIDTREQRPWHFPPEMAKTVRRTIDAGDYALLGDEQNFAIERKSMDDFTGTISSGWKRFRRELDRMKMAQFPARVIIVECDMDDIIKHRYNGKITPRFVMKRIAELALDNVSVLLGGNHLQCTGMAFAILIERHRRKSKQWIQ